MKNQFIIIFLLLSVSCFAQDTMGTIKVKKIDTSKYLFDKNNMIYAYTGQLDRIPVFPGGDQKKDRYIVSNLKYPEAEKKAKIQGVVNLSFIVEADGSITNVKILGSIPGGPGCDQEAIRLVKMMPKWTPGQLNGKPVASVCGINIKFQL